MALAFRNNVSGRDVFDLWYHWLRKGEEINEVMQDMLTRKLRMRALRKEDLPATLRTKMTHGITRRVEEEWDRYLPSSMKNKALYEDIFSTVKNKLSAIKL